MGCFCDNSLLAGWEARWASMALPRPSPHRSRCARTRRHRQAHPLLPAGELLRHLHGLPVLPFCFPRSLLGDVLLGGPPLLLCLFLIRQTIVPRFPDLFDEPRGGQSVLSIFKFPYIFQYQERRRRATRTYILGLSAIDSAAMLGKFFITINL